jgi:hypothetical protein
VDGEKQKRINSFKMKLEDSDRAVHGKISRENSHSSEETYVHICLVLLASFFDTCVALGTVIDDLDLICLL